MGIFQKETFNCANVWLPSNNHTCPPTARCITIKYHMTIIPVCYYQDKNKTLLISLSQFWKLQCEGRQTEAPNVSGCPSAEFGSTQVFVQTLTSRMLQAPALSLWQRSPDGTVKHSKIPLIKTYFIFFRWTTFLVLKKMLLCRFWDTWGKSLTIN